MFVQFFEIRLRISPAKQCAMTESWMRACSCAQSVNQISLGQQFSVLGILCSKRFVVERFSVFKQIIVLLLFGNRVQIAEISVQVDATVIGYVQAGFASRC